MQLPQKRILYVDDNADDYELLDLMLRNVKSAAYEMAHAQTVAEGIVCAQAARYDLIVLDHHYADGTSVNLCQQIRQFDPRTPILFFTADVRPSSRAAAFEAGAQAYLVKPNDLPLLVETIERLARDTPPDAV